MFQTLLADIRAAVIGRIFLYQPRLAAAQAETAASGPAAARNPQPAQGAPAAQSAQKKRKRHRH
jgi:hypothetical protein